MIRASGFTPEQVREAAAALTDPPAHGLDEGFTPVPKGVMTALFEHAFSGTATRGLAYPAELSDIADWLSRRAANYESQPDRYEILLATGAAWAAYYGGEEPSENTRALVRAVGTYFLRRDVGTAADVIAEGKDEGEDEPTEPGGAS